MQKIKVSAGMVFERHEKKYRLSEEAYLRLSKLLREYMQGDQYGRHTICTLYLDTDDWLLVRRSMEKPKYKEKLRLRSYGIPNADTTVFLELKKKLDGVTYKRRTPIRFAEAVQYLQYGEPPSKQGQILTEIDWFMNFYKPTPKILLFYERTALYAIGDSSLRITFDDNIRWRTDRLDFTLGDDGTLLLEPGERLMEIKAEGAFPYWLSRMLAELKIYPISFSKYGTVYRSLFAAAAAKEELTYAK